jgi:hypothetical protein
VHAGTDRAQLLDHEPPPGRRLQRDLELATLEPAQEPPHRLAMRRRHPRPAHSPVAVSIHSAVICPRC